MWKRIKKSSTASPNDSMNHFLRWCRWSEMSFDNRIHEFRYGVFGSVCHPKILLLHPQNLGKHLRTYNPLTANLPILQSSSQPISHTTIREQDYAARPKEGICASGNRQTRRCCTIRKSKRNIFETTQWSSFGHSSPLSRC